MLVALFCLKNLFSSDGCQPVYTRFNKFPSLGCLRLICARPPVIISDEKKKRRPGQKMGQRASSASHVHRLIHIKPENQYGRFFVIYHFQPCFTVYVCLFPPTLDGYTKKYGSLFNGFVSRRAYFPNSYISI